MDCYLRRLKQELVRAELAPLGGRLHPDGYLASALGWDGRGRREERMATGRQRPEPMLRGRKV